jgi:hypothetical protein
LAVSAVQVAVDTKVVLLAGLEDGSQGSRAAAYNVSVIQVDAQTHVGIREGRMPNLFLGPAHPDCHEGVEHKHAHATALDNPYISLEGFRRGGSDGASSLQVAIHVQYGLGDGIR